jgi:hypothetical protein
MRPLVWCKRNSAQIWLRKTAKGFVQHRVETHSRQFSSQSLYVPGFRDPEPHGEKDYVSMAPIPSVCCLRGGKNHLALREIED